MSDETETARNHLIMLMPVEYKNYIKTQLAGDFAFTIRNKLDEQQDTIDKLKDLLAGSEKFYGNEIRSRDEILRALLSLNDSGLMEPSRLKLQLNKAREFLGET